MHFQPTKNGVSVRSVGDGGILEGLKHFEKLLIGVIVVLAGDNAVGQCGRERPVLVRILTLTHAVAQLRGSADSAALVWMASSFCASRLEGPHWSAS